MKRFLTISLGALAMFAVAILCAFFAMRLAIHGREVVVPNLAGRTDAEAAEVAKDLGLNLSVENRFFSAGIPPNHVLSQSPVPGSRVRRGWQVRVTESLGSQKVAIPDVTGQTERPATLVLRRLQLEVGTVAHVPAPSPAGIVLAQSPPANSNSLNSPRVALLVSDEETAASEPGYVMPSIVGMTLSAASLRLATAGLHIASAEEPAPIEPAGSPDGMAVMPTPLLEPATPSPVPGAFTVSATIVGQSPAPGHRVTRSDTIRVTLSH